MQYLWEKFNIKTFPAHNVVFVDGIFRPEISETGSLVKIENDNIVIEKASDLPVHIISVGNSLEWQCLEVFIPKEETRVFFTAKIEIKKPAFLQLFIENAGKNSIFKGSVTAQNFTDFKLDIIANHLVPGTGIFAENRILAHRASTTELTGTTKIIADCGTCESDISFSAMCAPDIKSIKMSPNQRIASVPESAEHSASIYRGTKQQIQFLSGAGLSPDDVKKTLEEAFVA